MTGTQGSHLAQRSPLREEGHPNGLEMTEITETTAGLRETTLPRRPKEEETERLSTL